MASIVVEGAVYPAGRPRIAQVFITADLGLSFHPAGL